MDMGRGIMKIITIHIMNNNMIIKIDILKIVYNLSLLN